MPHISRRPMKPGMREKIFLRLFRSVRDAHTTTRSKYFLEDLLSPTEKLMLAKRLAMLLLVLEGASVYQIAETFTVSTSTARRMKLKIERNGCPYIVALYENRKLRKEFQKDILTLLRMGLPPRGRGRWKWLYDMGREHRARSKK